MTTPKEVHLFDTVLSVYASDKGRIAVKVIDRSGSRGKILINRDDFTNADDAIDFVHGTVEAFTGGVLDGTL